MNSLAGAPSERAVPFRTEAAAALRQPVVLWALVVLVAMLSFYVHLLNEQVLRGERLREAQRTGQAQKVDRQGEVESVRLSQHTPR